MFPISVLSTKKTVLQFFDKGFRFSESFFQSYTNENMKKSPVMVTENMSISQTEGYLKSPSIAFKRTYALSVDFKMNPLRKSAFLC